MIRFSIITITYNAADCLQRTLDSVERQTWPGLQHVIIDGASTDDTLHMAEQYKARNDADEASRHAVVITSEPDQGIYDAMNKGLKQASGDYVLFLNAGDCFPAADTLEQVVHRCRLEDLPSEELPAVLYGLTDITDAEGNVIGPRRFNAQLKRYSVWDSQPSAQRSQLTWRSFRQGMLVCHQAFFARADLARVTPYDLRYRYSADVDWCIRLMREAEADGLQIMAIGTTTALYRQDGQTTRHHRESLVERFHVMRRHYGLLTTIAMHLWFAVRPLNIDH